MNLLVDQSPTAVFWISRLLQQEAENFKKLNVITQDEFDTLSPKVPVDNSQDAPLPPTPGGIGPSKSDGPEMFQCLLICHVHQHHCVLLFFKILPSVRLGDFSFFFLNVRPKLACSR